MTSLKRCLFRSSMYFFIGFIFLMSYMSCLYILELNPLLVASFANIFSHSECYLRFVYGLLCYAKVFKVSWVPFIFVFIFITLGRGSKKILLRFMSKNVLPMFSSQGFIVSEGNGTPLQYSCLENPMDGGAW